MDIKVNARKTVVITVLLAFWNEIPFFLLKKIARARSPSALRIDRV
jgi:hypothetical protein